MIKQLFLTAALLVAGLAYGANLSTTLSVQIVPATSHPAVPASAQAAGFTTLALNADFSLPFYATQANWLDCAGATNPQWYRAWMGFGSNIAGPCSASSQQVDPLTGQNALQIHWQDNYYSSGTASVTVIQTVDNNGNGNRIPPNAYFEVTARDDVPSAHGLFDMWSYTTDGTSIEWDGIEVWGATNDANSCQHNNAAGIVDCIWSGTPPIGGIDYTQYHTYAWRVTSDGATAGFWCAYIDNQPQGCSNWHATAGELAGIDTTMQMLQGMNCRGPAPPCNNGFPINAWIKSVRIFSCAGVNSGAKCFTGNPNP